MANIIQIRRDAAADWTSIDPTLAQGEFGYETDTGRIKIGDALTAWTSLGYSFETASNEPWATTSLTGGATEAPDFATNELMLCNCTTNAIIINLPASSALTYKKATIVKTDSSANTVTINPNGAETINGDASLIIQYENTAMTLMCTGSAWRII